MKNLLISAGLCLLVIGLFQIDTVFAQVLTADQTFGGDLTGDQFAAEAGLGSEDLVTVIAKVIRVILGLLGVIAVVLILYAGFLWMFSKGDVAKVDKARKYMINAVIGLVIVLSSFAIASFIIGALVGATTGSITPGGPTVTPNINPPPSNIFVMESINNQCTAVRNFELRMGFSNSVDEDTVLLQPGIAVTSANNGGSPVSGTFDVSGSVVTFTPSAVCLGYPNERCFDAGDTYQVRLEPSILRSTSGRILTCSITYPCIETFSVDTNASVDLIDPTVDMSYPSDGASVFLGIPSLLQSHAVDDLGVATMDFYLEGDVFDMVDLDDAIAPFGPVNWFQSSWDSTSYVVNEYYSLRSRGYDCAGNDDYSDTISVILRPPNCGNSIWDSGAPYLEEALNCGGDPTSDYYCGSCAGAACETDFDCSSGFCIDGFCVDSPVIDEVSPGDGASGNLVTISGRGFGAAPGTVVFHGDITTAADDIIVPPTPLCSGTWSNTQIIVEVPVISATPFEGPVEVIIASGDTDRTDSAPGPVISDFIVNTTVRPGLCSVTPDNGPGGTVVALTGNNLGSTQGSSVYYIGYTEATSYPAWANTSFSAVVPNLASSIYQTQAFVGVGDDREGSNKLRFSLGLSAAVTEPPRITFIDSGISRCSHDGSICGVDAHCGLLNTCDPAIDKAPVGQYVTIFGSGFGPNIGTVSLQNQSNLRPADGGTAFPAACDGNFWRDDYIVTIVPENYDLSAPLPLDTGLHDLWIVRASDGIPSNAVDLEIISGVAGPNICNISPTGGPPGTLVTVDGDRFDATAGSSTFYDGETGSITAWANEQVYTVVPADAISGPMFLTDVSGYNTNSVGFEVGFCGIDFLCGIGDECCSDGSCELAGGCSTGPVTSHYAYTFSTAEIPPTPAVIFACNSVAVSPSPWIGYDGGAEVCVDAAIRAEFSTDMDTVTYGLGGVILESCADFACESTTPVSVNVTPPAISTNRVLQFSPTANFIPGTRYQVTLTGGSSPLALTSTDGIPLLSDVSWQFVTSATAVNCEVGTVTVSPPTYTINAITDTKEFAATPRDDTYECTVLACTNYTYNWTATDPLSSATILPAAACTGIATPVRETTPGIPVDIEATLMPNNIDGNADLIINFSDPEVTNYFPNCSTACINALAFAEFNIAMNATTFNTTDSLGNDTVRLDRCVDELCISGMNFPVTLQANVYTSANKRVVITPTSDLLPDTYYRVTLSGEIESTSGVPLSESGANYGNDFSWIFKTKDSAVACAIASVNILPKTATLNVVGAKQDFSASTLGAPDDCAVGGQLLSNAGIDWNAWSATDDPNLVVDSVATVASLYASGEVRRDFTELPAWCTPECLNAGAPALNAVCGNGYLEPGEDCDDNNTAPNDGCSVRCINEGSNTLYSAPSVCGDGSVGIGEECEDGNIVSGDGCSSLCLREGSSSVGAECGNGITAALGEDCDDGNLTNGDGCSAICLNEGSITSSLVYAVCGDGSVGLGEECEDGNTDSGDGCNSSCLWEGSNINYGSVCGNSGIPEYGEECDSVEGCDPITCLWIGSSYEYGVPAICADGIGPMPATVSEECEVSSIPGDISNYAVAIIDSTAPNEVTESANNLATSTITATAVNPDLSTVSGEAVLGLECACNTDLSCGNSTSFGCGASNCCYERPTLAANYPNGSNVCRNSAVWFDFTKVMDPNSFIVDVSTSVQDHRLYLELTEVNSVPVTAANCPATHEFFVSYSESTNIFARAWNWVVNSFNRIFRQDVVAAPILTASAICRLPVTYDVQPMSLGLSRVYVNYSDLLVEDGKYRWQVEGDMNQNDALDEGIWSVDGVSVITSSAGSFNVGSEVCELEQVFLEDLGKTPLGALEDPSSEYYSSTGETHNLRATPYTLRGAQQVEITPISGVYSWSWSGTGIHPVTLLAQSWNWFTNDNNPLTDSIAVVNANLPNTTASATGINGEEQITAQARIDDDIFTDSVGTIINGSIYSTAFVCENPWPSLSSFPYQQLSRTGDTELYSFFYCRDYGDPDTTADDLPGITPVPTPVSPSSDIFQEVLYIIDGTGDAIGMRASSNEGYLNPLMWYLDKEFSGSPNMTTFDGYEAVVDGNTMYVNAAGWHQPSTRFIPNMMTISLDQDAGEESLEIFNRVKENWQFWGEDITMNACKTSASGDYLLDRNGNPISCSFDAECLYEDDLDEVAPFAVLGAQNCEPNNDDLPFDTATEYGGCNVGFCDAYKDKLERNLKRLTDIKQIEGLLETYSNQNRRCSVTKAQSCSIDSQCPGDEICVGTYPDISAGSFLRSYSVSNWPSWNAVFANELGKALPVDPLNIQAQCPYGVDNETCFDGDNAQFSCNAETSSYIYRNIGGESYVLGAIQEPISGYRGWYYDFDASSTNGEVASFYTPNAPLSSASGFYPLGGAYCGTPLGASETCGDGVLGDNEICEIGQSRSVDGAGIPLSCTTCLYPNGSTDTDGCTSDSDCSAGGSCEPGTTSQGCYIDSLNTCAWDTANPSACIPFQCGNGVIESPETCDDGALNGQYGFCGADCSLVTSFFCGDGSIAGGEACDNGIANGQYTAAIGSSCAFDCAYPGPSCGDGVVQDGNEVCDGGYQEYAGKICVGGTDMWFPCSDGPNECPGSTCGLPPSSPFADVVNACEISRVCEAGPYIGAPCTSNVNCGSGGICSVQSYQLTRSTTCRTDCSNWNPWNNVGLNLCLGGNEVCGNGIIEGTEACDDGNDSNTDDCTNSCEFNVCGDGNLFISTESCDAGTKNGIACTPGYDESCSYCTSSCRYTVVSGEFCGDFVVQESDEYCDNTTVSKRCFKPDGTAPSIRDVGDTCVDDGDCPGDYYCREVGACNGGERKYLGTYRDFNGAPCEIGSVISNYSCGVNSIADGTERGECAPQDCSNNCQSACPYSYDATQVLIQTEPFDAPGQASSTLYSFPSTEGPDTAVLQMPACTVGTAFTANVNMENVTPPDVDIYFVTDLSQSMNSNDRIENTVTAMTLAIQELFDAYSSYSSVMRIGLISYAHTTDPATVDGGVMCTVYSSNNDYAWIDSSLSTESSENMLLAEVATYVDRATASTPTGDGYGCAIDSILATSTADEKFIVLMSDGSPTRTFRTDFLCENDDILDICVPEIMTDVRLRTRALGSGIHVYTAALTTSNSLKGYMKHFSSDLCGATTGSALANVNDCTPNQGREYAFSGNTAAELNVVYQTIVDSILGTSVSFTTDTALGPEVTSGVVRAGLARDLTFPLDFTCPGSASPWELPISLSFYGEGYASIGNIGFNYCPRE